MRLAVRLAALGAALLVAGCQTDGGEDPPPASPTLSEALATLPPPQPGAEPTAPPPLPVPHIYMALQDEGDGKPVSVIFAIDAARDGTPSDDPAVRLTPEGGLCNPQEMSHFEFPPGTTPVFAEPERDQGMTAADLPGHLAATVTVEMMARGLAPARESTRAQNVCTRKLWERLIAEENRAAPPAGQ